jgi:hypothetical protein
MICVPRLVDTKFGKAGGIKHDLGHAESAKKSERCGKAWTKKRHNANGQAAMSARVPAWLTAVKGQPIRVIPERARIVRQIFDWSAKGLGQYVICDKLIKANMPAWGPVYKGRPPCWTPFYVSAILSSRAVIGEYTPHAKKAGKRIPDGPPVADYYTAVVPALAVAKGTGCPHGLRPKRIRGGPPLWPEQVLYQECRIRREA